MNKKLRNLIILVASALVIVAAFVILPKLEPKEDLDNMVTPEPTMDPALLTFSDYSAEDIVKLTLDYNDNITVLKYDSDGETVVIEGHEDIALNQTQAKNVLYTASKVVVEKIITEDMSNIAQFGLEDPEIVATAEYSDGKTNTFYFGNNVPGSGQYYMMMEGVDKVFVVWNNYGNNAKSSLNDLVEVESISMTIDEISDINIIENGETYMSFSNIAGKTTLVDMNSWKLTKPYYRSLDSSSEESKWTLLYTELLDLLGEDDVLDSAGDAADYGLDNPWIQVEFTKTTGETIAISFAEENEDGICAMKFSDSDIIYKVNPKVLGFMDYEAFDLVEKLLMLINIRYVDEIILEGVVGDDTVIVSHSDSVDENGEPKLDGNGEQIVNTGYIVDGVELTEDEIEQGSWFYQNILSVKLLREADKDFTPSKPAGTVSLSLSEEPFTYTINFYEYDDYFYAVKINDDDVLFVANKDDVLKIKDTYELLKTREVEKPY